MNKLIFLGDFTTEDLDTLSDLLEYRYRNDHYTIELYEDALEISVSEFSVYALISLIPDGFRIESDDFFTILEVAEVVGENFEEDPEKRALFLNPM